MRLPNGANASIVALWARIINDGEGVCRKSLPGEVKFCGDAFWDGECSVEGFDIESIDGEI